MAYDPPFQHLTVIGLGLIGGSVAMAAREVFPEIWIQGVDTNPDALTYAIQSDIVDKVSRTVPEFFAENHLIVLATHLSSNLDILEALSKIVPPNTESAEPILITDIGSCKRAIHDLGKTLLPQQFIGGHPMAGKEFSGIQQAASLLFAGKSYLLCPHEETPPHLLHRLEAFVKGIGAVPRSVDPATHDRYMAYVSHLPQLYSILLTNLLYKHEPGRLLSYHGGGIDDQLRLAASPYSMWKDIFSQNSDNLKNVLEELGGMMGDAKDILDTPALEEWFSRSNYLHQEFQEMRFNRQLS